MQGRVATSDDTLDRRSFSLFALVLGAAVLIGFTLLPWLSRSRNALVGKPAPDFALEVIDRSGDRVKLSDLRGKAVVLSFWASWCGPCQIEAPSLDRLWKRLRDRNVEILGINTNDQLANGAAFIHKKNLSYTFLFDAGSEVAERYGVNTLPTLVVIDKNGVVIAIRTGLTDESSIEALLSTAL